MRNPATIVARSEAVARLGSTAALAGVGALTAGSLAAGFAYTGKAGEAFNPLNHFVSELGELGVSTMAGAFNTGLMIGGAGFVVFMVCLAAALGGWPRFLWGPVGVVAGIGGIFVGIFPMNDLAHHSTAAMTFFNWGWISVAIASVDIVRRRDPRVPRWLALIGAATVGAFLWFLDEIPRNLPKDGGHFLASPADRPAFWLLTTLEWAVLVGILTWVVAAALTWRWAALGGEAPEAAGGLEPGR